MLILSPGMRQSGEFLNKAEAFARMLGVRPRGDGLNEKSMLFPNGSRIVGLPGTQNTVRGFSKVSLLMIDEAARVEDDLYNSVRPMLAVSDGDMWLMSTPHGRRGFFWEEWNNPDEWDLFAVPATECPRIKAEFLKREQAKGDWWFRQE